MSTGPIDDYLRWTVLLLIRDIIHLSGKTGPFSLQLMFAISLDRLTEPSSSYSHLFIQSKSMVPASPFICDDIQQQTLTF